MFLITSLLGVASAACRDGMPTTGACRPCESARAWVFQQGNLGSIDRAGPARLKTAELPRPTPPGGRPCAALPRPRKKKNVADPSGTALYDAEASPGGSKAERKLKLRSPNNRRGENSDPNRFGSAAARAGSGAGLRGAHAQQPGGATTVIRAHRRRRRGRKGCPNQAWVAQNLPRRWSREEVGPRRPSCAS